MIWKGQSCNRTSMRWWIIKTRETNTLLSTHICLQKCTLEPTQAIGFKWKENKLLWLWWCKQYQLLWKNQGHPSNSRNIRCIFRDKKYLSRVVSNQVWGLLIGSSWRIACKLNIRREKDSLCWWPSRRLVCPMLANKWILGRSSLRWICRATLHHGSSMLEYAKCPPTTQLQTSTQAKALHSAPSVSPAPSVTPYYNPCPRDGKAMPILYYWQQPPKIPVQDLK